MTVLIVADNGDLYLLHLIVMDVITKLTVRTGANANIASSIAAWSYNSPERLFLDKTIIIRRQAYLKTIADYCF